MGDAEETFRDVVARALRLVHAALGEALARLAEHGVTGRTYFTAGGWINCSGWYPITGAALRRIGRLVGVRWLAGVRARMKV